MKPAPKDGEGPFLPRCGHPGCNAWGVFGDGRAYRCRVHLWPGFLPGDAVPALLAATSAALDAETPPRGQGSLL
jgi:hypothetical protein